MNRDRRWWIGLLVVAAMIGLVLLFRERSRPIIAPSRVVPVPEVHAALQPVAKPPLVVSSEAVPEKAANRIEICGVGKVPLDATDPSAAYTYVSTLTQRTAEGWLAALLRSDDYRARAVGLLLEGKIIANGSMRPMAERTRDELVQHALGARDPAVYAMALYACNTHIEDPANSACQQISLRGWAKLDPDNAVPWLLVAGKAHEEHDAAVETEAFDQSAKAHRTDSYNDSMFAFAEAELPKDATPLERFYLATELIGIESGTRENQYTVAGKHCSTEAIRDNHVRQQCSALAELLVTKGTILLDLAAGAHIGKSVGWSAERLASLRQEREALMQAVMEVTGNDDYWSCNGVRLGNAYVTERLRLGEVGAAREIINRAQP